VKKKFKLSLEEYNVLTQICCVEGCYWKWCINLHHLDGDKNNNSLDNLVPLCFNHHILLHGAAIKFEELENYSAGGDKL